MQKIITRLLMAMFAMAVAMPVAARSKKAGGAGSTVVYVYGVAQNLGDTIVYFSSITPVAGATLKNHRELENRVYYSEQFKKYIEEKYSSPHQTVAVVYGKKLKAVEKRFRKMEEKIRRKSPYPPAFKYIRPEDFHFRVPVIVQADEEVF